MYRASSDAWDEAWCETAGPNVDIIDAVARGDI
jgi:hypothetical protein